MKINPGNILVDKFMEICEMRILHVWDQGINELLVRHMDQLYGTESMVIHNADFDPFNHTPEKWKHHYSGKFYRITFNADVIRAALSNDIVHVHSYDEIIPLLKSLRRRIVLHYHGSDIRGCWPNRQHLWSKADRILVSTKDLLIDAPSHVVYQPNPIDTELFKSELSKHPVKGAAYINYGAVDLAEIIAKNHGLDLHVENQGIPYYNMPKILSRYTHYIDIKRDYRNRVLYPTPETYSLIGLQALACGSTVLNQHGECSTFPLEHRPEVVVEKIFHIYEEVLSDG